jgi:hypothetical protein
VAASEDIDENLSKVDEVRYWQQRLELQNRIEIPVNNHVRFRN